MEILEIKPLSVNEAWKGKRYKTDKYKDYEKEVLLRLKKHKLPNPPYAIIFEFGLNSQADWDNPVKPFQDILSKKLEFNDKRINLAVVMKKEVKTGNGYIRYKIISLSDLESLIQELFK